MNNTELLNNYDMILSYPVEALNIELQKLVREGTIQTNIILYRTVNNAGNYVYNTAVSAGAVPQGAEYINGSVQPQLQVRTSGNEVMLVLQFMAGTAWFASKNSVGPLAKPQEYNMAGWQYGFAVNLNQQPWSNGACAAPGAVTGRLNQSIAAQFNAAYVFLDFVSSDLLSPDPGVTNCPAEMTLFMSFYFSNLKGGANPYVLGYSLTAQPATRFANELPASLKPASAGYAVYGGAPPAIDFIMNTAGGHGSMQGQPPAPDSPWQVPMPPGMTGLLVISHNCLVEQLFTEPFYNTLQQTVYQQISGQLNVPPGNSYQAGRQATGNGWNFTISNISSGNDQYVNQFSVHCMGGGPQVILFFNGMVLIHKEVSKNDFFCTASATATSIMEWEGQVTISVQNGRLQTSSSFRKTGGNSQSGQNTCAKAFSWIGKIMGGILDVFTFWSDEGFFSNLLSKAFSVNVPGVGSVQLALGNIMPAINTLHLLPSGASLQAGMVFTDGNGNLYITLQES